MNKFDEIEEDNNQVVDKQQDESSIGEKFMVLCDQELKKIIENTQEIKVQTTIAPQYKWMGIQGSTSTSIFGSGFSGFMGTTGSRVFTGLQGVTGFQGVTGLQARTTIAPTTIVNDPSLFKSYHSLLNSVIEEPKSIVKKIFTKKEKSFSKFSIL